jgi:hypothetical protein
MKWTALAIAIAALLAGCASSQRFSSPPQRPQYQAPMPHGPHEMDDTDRRGFEHTAPLPRPAPRGLTRLPANPVHRREEEAGIIWNQCPAPYAVQQVRGWRCI